METTVNNPTTRLYQLIFQRSKDEQLAADIVNSIEGQIAEKVDQQTKPLATREDLLHALNELKEQNRKDYVNNLKWMIILILGLYAAVILPHFIK